MRYVTTLSLLFVILVSPAASQPPTLAEQPLVIDGRVLWIDFGSQTLMLAPATGSPAIAIDLHDRRLSRVPWERVRAGGVRSPAKPPDPGIPALPGDPVVPDATTEPLRPQTWTRNRTVATVVAA